MRDLQSPDHGAERQRIDQAAAQGRRCHDADHRRRQQGQPEHADRARAEAIDQHAAQQGGDRLRGGHRAQQADGEAAIEPGLSHRPHMIEQQRGVDRVDQQREGGEIPEVDGPCGLGKRQSIHRPLDERVRSVGAADASEVLSRLMLRPVATEREPDRQHDAEHAGAERQIGGAPARLLPHRFGKRRHDQPAQRQSHHRQRRDAAAVVVEPQIDHL